MSLGQMQAAIAHMIRTPAQLCDISLCDFFEEYDLSQEEKDFIAHVAGDRQVQAFNDDMAELRWQSMDKVLFYLYPFIERDVTSGLWHKHFDPKQKNAAINDLQLKFLEYLAYDKQALYQLPTQQCRYLPDLLRYFHALHYFGYRQVDQDSSPIHPDGLLQHSAFKVLQLQFDVRQICDDMFNIEQPRPAVLLDQDDTTPPEAEVLNQFDISAYELGPLDEPLHVLFVANLKMSGDFRSFEVDHAVFEFLEQQNCGADTGALPQCYEQLVGLGLCKPLDRQKQLVFDIQRGLAEHGYFHLRESMSHAEFEELGSCLGHVVGRDDIKLYVTERKLHSPEAIEFHTDSFVSDINAWRCERVDDESYATSLIDTRPFLADSSPALLRGLERVMMECPNRVHTTRYLKPLLSYSDQGEAKIFYTPWFLCEPKDEDAKLAGQAFQDFVSEMSSGVVDIVLKEGECFFIDNKRMLHGRGDLPTNAQRHLQRLWIATQQYEENLAE